MWAGPIDGGEGGGAGVTEFLEDVQHTLETRMAGLDPGRAGGGGGGGGSAPQPGKSILKRS